MKRDDLSAAHDVARSHWRDRLARHWRDTVATDPPTRSRTRLTEAAIVLAISVATVACGGTAQETTADMTSSAASETRSAPSASDAVAEEQTLEFGPLAADVRYVIDGPPSISFVPGVDANAFPSAGGALVSIRDIGVRFATGITDVYVGRGDQEPLGEDLSGLLEAFARNDRIAISETGTSEIGGSEATFVDFTLPYDANIEGGTPILSADASPLFIPDLTVSRAFLVNHTDGLAVIVVSAPEDSDLESTLSDVDPLLASVEVGGED